VFQADAPVKLISDEDGKLDFSTAFEGQVPYKAES